MDEDRIDIEEIDDIGEMPLEEEYEDIEDIEDEQMSVTVIDHIETEMQEMKPKKTIPCMTKYEKALLIGTRAQELNNGALPTVNVGGLKSTVSIAEKELRERKLPMIIRRHLPDGSFEDWKIDELIYTI